MRLHRLLVCSVVTAFAFASSGYTSRQVGVDSNLLIDGGRVIFAQSDGSLTALSLESGQVLQRNKTAWFSGTLRRVPEGILVLSYGKITLLEPGQLRSLWQTDSCYEPNILEGVLVSRKCRVRRRDIPHREVGAHGVASLQKATQSEYEKNPVFNRCYHPPDDHGMYCSGRRALPAREVRASSVLRTAASF